MKLLNLFDKYAPLILGTLAFIIGFFVVLAIAILESLRLAAVFVWDKMVDFTNDGFTKNFQKWKRENKVK